MRWQGKNRSKIRQKESAFTENTLDIRSLCLPRSSRPLEADLKMHDATIVNERVLIDAKENTLILMHDCRDVSIILSKITKAAHIINRCILRFQRRGSLHIQGKRVKTGQGTCQTPNHPCWTRAYFNCGKRMEPE